MKWRTSYLETGALAILCGLAAGCTPTPKDDSTRATDTPVSIAPDIAARTTRNRNVMTDQDKGRRIVSSAFVRVGPDGYLTVELRSGERLVLRDVTIGAAQYCGTSMPTSAKHCGDYADIVSAAPGGGPARVDTALPGAETPAPR